MKRIKHYNIIEKLGTGGMGVVYKAFDTILERDVAIKVMHQHLLERSINEKRFRNEARAAAKLTHSNIVTIYEIGKDTCGNYIVMEFIDGESIHDLLMRTGKCEPARAVQIIHNVLCGLSVAHKMNITHRDIKSENIFIAQGGIAKILDFGIAKMSAAKGLTVAGDILGTIEYMAPEQMLGEVADHRCDLYSVAVMLYQLLTNILPFTGETPAAILYKQLNEEPIPPSYYTESISPHLDTVLMKALSKNPDERWQSADEFDNALQNDQPENTNNAKESSIYNAIIHDTLDEKNDDDRPENKFILKASFIGRETEFKKMAYCYDQVLQKKGKAILLVGEAGTGKTTLAGHVQDWVRERGGITFYGSCLYQEGMNAYLPYIDALKKFFNKDIHAFSREKRASIQTIVREKVPSLLAFMERFKTTSSSKEIAETPHPRKGIDHFENIHLFTSLISSIQPAVFVLDDMQWADEASLRLFHYISRQAENERTMIIGISRTDRYDLYKNGKPSMAANVFSRMLKEGSVIQIQVDRFPKEMCETLIDESIPDALFSENFYEQIYQETSGNPFFIIETLKYLQETGHIYYENKAWHAGHADFHHEVPKRVEDVFARRLNALSDEEREIMQTAAIIGNKFDISILSTILQMQKIKLLKSLQSINRGLKLLIGTEEGFQFEHPLMRDILYNEMPPVLRKEYHRVIAEEMAKIYEPDYGAFIGDVAQHCRRGGLLKKAISLLHGAGNRSFRNHFYREASAYYEDMHKSIKECGCEFPSDIPLVRHYQKLAICYEETDRLELSLETYKKGREKSQENKNVQGEIEILRRMGRVCSKLAKYDIALTCFNRALALLREHPVNNIVGRIYSGIGNAYVKMGKFEEGLFYFHGTTELQDKHITENDRGNALRNIGNIHNSRGEYDEALNYLKKALAIYIDLNNPHGKMHVYYSQGMAYFEQKKWRDATVSFVKCYEHAEELEKRHIIGSTLMQLGKIYAMEKKESESEKLVMESIKIFKRSGDMINVAENYLVLGIIHASRGDYEAAEISFDDSIKLYFENGNKEGAANAFSLFAATCHEQGLVDLARENYKKSISLYKGLNLPRKYEYALGQYRILKNRAVDKTAGHKNITHSKAKANTHEHLATNH